MRVFSSRPPEISCILILRTGRRESYPAASAKDFRAASNQKENSESCSYFGCEISVFCARFRVFLARFCLAVCAPNFSEISLEFLKF